MTLEGQKPPFNIERQQLKQGQGLEAKMDIKPVMFVESDAIKSEAIRKHPFLFRGDDRVRVSGEGDIFTVSYRSTKPMNNLFVDLPTDNSRILKKIIWSKSEDVESAIQRSDIVADKYDPKTGEVILNIRGVIARIIDVSREYHRSGITEEERQKLAEDTAAVLVASGFGNTTKPEKQIIANKILGAGQRDVLQRINPPRTRLILSSAWIDLTKELVVGRKTKEKYKSIRGRLIREREMERFLLGQTAERIESILGLREKSKEWEKEVQELKEFVYQQSSPEQIKVKPYVRAAAISRFYLFGDGEAVEHDQDGKATPNKPNAHLRWLQKHLPDGEANLYHGLPKFDSLDSEGKVLRLRAAAFEINAALMQGEKDLPLAA